MVFLLISCWGEGSLSSSPFCEQRSWSCQQSRCSPPSPPSSRGSPSCSLLQPDHVLYCIMYPVSCIVLCLDHLIVVPSQKELLPHRGSPALPSPHLALKVFNQFNSLPTTPAHSVCVPACVTSNGQHGQISCHSVCMGGASLPPVCGSFRVF